MENKNNQDNNSKTPKNGQTILILVIAAVITFFSISLMKDLMTKSSTEELTYDKFVSMLENKEVESVIIDSSTIQIMPKKDVEGYSSFIKYYTVRMNDYKLSDRVLESGAVVKQAKQDSSMILETILSFLIPFICIVFFMNLMMKRMGGGGIMGVGKSNAKVYMQKETGVTFKDVAGQDEAKESLVEIVDFLHNPGKYTHIGGSRGTAECPFCSSARTTKTSSPVWRPLHGNIRFRTREPATICAKTIPAAFRLQAFPRECRDRGT